MPLAFYLVERLGAPRNHHALFIRLNESDGTGHTFHVTGNIQNGMTYESEPAESPKKSVSYISMTQLGWVASSDLDRINDICRSNPAPEKQFDGAKRINPKKPLRRCQEWTSETIQQLKAHGVLKYGTDEKHGSDESGDLTICQARSP